MFSAIIKPTSQNTRNTMMDATQRKQLVKEARKTAQIGLNILYGLATPGFTEFDAIASRATLIQTANMAMEDAERLLFDALMGDHTVNEVHINGKKWEPQWVKRFHSMKDIKISTVKEVEGEFSLYLIGVLDMIEVEESRRKQMVSYIQSLNEQLTQEELSV